MIFKNLRFVTSLLIVVMSSAYNATHVGAALQVLDFGLFAENGVERGYGFGDHIRVFNPDGANLPASGVGLSLFAWNLTDSGTLGVLPTTAETTLGDITSGATLTDIGTVNQTTGAYAYMDGLSGGRPAGLGAAQVLDLLLHVDPSDDDNVGIGGASDPVGLPDGVREIVGIRFDFDKTVFGFTFRDANHYLYDENDSNSGGKADIDITFDGGGNWTRYTTGAGGVVNLGPGGVFVDSDDIIAFAYTGNNDQFYLSSVTIPEASSALVWVGLVLAGGGAVSGRQWRRVSSEGAK